MRCDAMLDQFCPVRACLLMNDLVSVSEQAQLKNQAKFNRNFQILNLRGRSLRLWTLREEWLKEMNWGYFFTKEGQCVMIFLTM